MGRSIMSLTMMQKVHENSFILNLLYYINVEHLIQHYL